MAKVQIFSISKTKVPWLIQAIEEYSSRLRPILSIYWHLVRNEEQLFSLLKKQPYYIALDPKGRSFTSEEFSDWTQEIMEEKGAVLNFAIGGAEGFPKEILKNSFTTISLSSLTFTHQMTRLLLVEQLYRAFEIQKGSKYHK